MPTLLLVDGSSYLYRAFHALPDLRNRVGEPTGAIRGVISMLHALLADYPADYRAVVFDAKGPTFRDDIYADYKAHRPPMPDDLVAQIAPLHDCIRAAGWPLLTIAGVEADDVIGALARTAAAAEMDCVIATGDKDLAQLVTPRITLVNTLNNEVLDPAGVLAKFGVPPERIVDYLALVGDTVDNVPGVAKVGPKTAVKWLNAYGSLAEIVAHADEIKGVVGENLRKHLDFLPTGVELVTIRCDIPLTHTLDELRPGAPDRARLRELYSRLEFKGWLQALRDDSPDTAPAPAASPTVSPAPTFEAAAQETRSADDDCALIADAASLAAWLVRLQNAPRVALSIAASADEPLQAHPVGIAWAIPADPGADHRIDAAYLPLAHNYAGAPDQLTEAAAFALLKPWLESSQARILGHHLGRARHTLANRGIALDGVIDDTLLQSYILESGKSHELESLAARHAGLKIPKEEGILGKGASRLPFAQLDLDHAARYLAQHCRAILGVDQALRPQLAAQPPLEKLYRELELPLAKVLTRMERNGVRVDAQALAQQSHTLGQRMMTLEAEAQHIAQQPFNLNSPKQLAEILFKQQGLPVIKKTPSGSPSTDEDVLEKLAEDYPLPKKLLEYRHLAKLKSTYTDKLPKMISAHTGRVHTRYAQAVAVTGRLSSTDPNLQNIPIRSAEGRRIRSAFVAAPGCRLVSADYSQIELRIMAHLSDDPRLLQAFAQGEDIHRATAAEIFGLTPLEVGNEQRRAAKVINFGLIYGMSAFGLAKELHVDRQAAAAYMDRYFARYPGVARYMESTRQMARACGHVETVFGRRLELPEIAAGNAGRRQAAERAAINAPMQGTAADLIKRAMLAVQDWLDREGLRTRMLLQVHDELILEVPEDEVARLRIELPKLMAGVAQLKVPLIVDVGVGDNWDAAH